MLLAQIAGYSIVHIALAIIVIAGIIGIVFVVTRQMGITIPPFIVNVLWIILAVVIGVVAVKFIATLF